MEYNIDTLKIKENKKVLTGWVIPNNYSNYIQVQVHGKDNQLLETKVVLSRRIDVSLAWFSDKEHNVFGYDIYFNENAPTEYTLVFQEFEDEQCNTLVGTYTVHLSDKKILSLQKLRQSKAFKAVRYFKEKGFIGLAKKVTKKVLKIEDANYEKWFQKQLATEGELEKQRNTTFEYEPLISILVPIYNTPLNFLDEMIQSVKDQTYANWELCLANGSPENEPLKEAIKSYIEEDSRIKCKEIETNLGISGNTNVALEIATGDFVALFDHDDLLAKDVLYHCVAAINEDEFIDAIYTDEDKVVGESKKHAEPHFKPDFNLELLRTCNYITHFFVVRKEIVDKVGGFRSKYDGAQDYDFIFRCTELARRVKHIPKILYHWRIHSASTAENPENKMYCYEAGINASKDHLERCNKPRNVVMSECYGVYSPQYEWKKEEVLVTVIVSNISSESVIKNVIQSLFYNINYKNIQCIFALKQGEKYPYLNKLKILGKADFSYKPINEIAHNAKGEYLLFFDARLQFLTENALGRMLDILSDENVGAVGSRILTSAGINWHAGIVVGINKTASRMLTDCSEHEYSYNIRDRETQYMSAVSGKCLLTKKELFVSVGGFTSEVTPTLNDVDYCLKLREKGFEIVYDALTKVRFMKGNLENDTLSEEEKEKQERFFMERWAKVILDGDPYYNPNLSLIKNDYSIAFNEETPWLQPLKDIMEVSENYSNWVRYTKMTETNRNQEKRELFSYHPTIVFIVKDNLDNLYETKELLRSLERQTYTNWRLVIVSSACSSEVKEYLQGNDVILEKVSYHMVETLDEVLFDNPTLQLVSMIQGNCVLTEDACYEIVNMWNKQKDLTAIYSDEDFIDLETKEYILPYYKPDFNLELQRSNNYMGNFVVVKAEMFDRLKQATCSMDFHLQLAEKGNIGHVSKVLYHGRILPYYLNKENQMPEQLIEKELEALKQHFIRINLPAKVEVKTSGIYKITYQRSENPLVSIIIPNKDYIEQLTECIDSVQQSSYNQLEIIIVENNSTKESTFEGYKKLQETYDNLQVVTWDKEFNYSAINNFGVTFAKGEYLLFLNNDTKLIKNDSIEELLSCCMRNDVGLVGAQLWYEDDTIQHAGVIVGLGGAAGHILDGEDSKMLHYFGTNICKQEMSVQTAACFMVKASVFKEVEGFYEPLKVAYNDVDFCLKVRQLGYKVIYNPDALLYHFASKTRGADNTEEKIKRLQEESNIFMERFGQIIEQGDPFYNKNLSRMTGKMWICSIREMKARMEQENK